MVDRHPGSLSRSSSRLLPILLLFSVEIVLCEHSRPLCPPSGSLGTRLIRFSGPSHAARSSSQNEPKDRKLLSTAGVEEIELQEQPGLTAAAGGPDSDTDDNGVAATSQASCASVQRLSKGIPAAAAAASINWPGCSISGNKLVWMPQRCGSSLQALRYTAVYAVSNKTQRLARSTTTGAPCIITQAAAASSQALASQLLSSSCGAAPPAARSLPLLVCAAAPDPCFGSNPQANAATAATATMRLSTPIRCPSTGELIRLLDYSGKPCGPGSRFTQWFEATSRSGCKISAASLAAVLRITSATPQSAARALEFAKVTSDVFGSCGLPPALASPPQSTSCVVSPGPSTGSGNGGTNPAMPKAAVKAGDEVAAPLQRIGVGADGQVADLSQIPADKQVTVAVIDSGIDRTHPDLNVIGGKSWVPASAAFPKDDDWGVDYFGHGTQAAGIIAARNNGARLVGVSPGARLFSLKVVNGNGTGTWSPIFQAIQWVISEGRRLYNIRVVNFSQEMSPLGTIETNDPSYNTVYAMACGLMQRADEAGVLVVVSAANRYVSLRTSFPAVCQSAAAVTALDADISAPLISSNYLEATASDTEKAHVFAAPGSDILTTQPMADGPQLDSTSEAGVYYMSGTSASAPFVSGVAANCLMSGGCAANSSGSDVIATLQAAARERAEQQPSSGYSGDPLTPNAAFVGKYYGYLVWSKW